MFPVSPYDARALHVLIQVAPVDVLGQDIGDIMLSFNFANREFSFGDSVLCPELQNLYVTNFAGTSSRGNALRSTRVRVHLTVHA